ncbi:MAG: sugar ABC transporter ATP-binding protein [Treponema sp.]|jgi:ribose transport system ATP-binding protein|nr:sugar ABC transporter ATP-binding protein [Treponema sp.]
MDEVMLRTEGINIAFPGVKALTDVNFSVKKGEIRALVGKNGAGKSTLIKIITGMYHPAAGKFFIENTEVKNAGPELMTRLGVKAIYQDNDLIPYFTIGESVMLRNEPVKGVFVDRKLMHEQARVIFKDRLGVDIDPYTLVRELNVSQQQLVQIAASLLEKPRIMIFDEPTAALSVKEIDKLFEIIFALKSEGVSIIYISHRFGEVFKLADSITILTDGIKVADLNLKDTTEDEVISLMAGNERFNKTKTRIFNYNGAESALSIKGLNDGFLKDIDFDLYKGEILGFYGGEGAGQQELAKAIFGESKITVEKFKLFGKETRLNSPGRAIKEGIAYIPRNRLEEGIVRGFNVRENITLPKIRSFSRMEFISRRKEETTAREHISKLDIKTPSSLTPIASLSGGNQQKVVLARWIVVNPRILILDYPTIGIDVRAKNEVYKILLELAGGGMSLILITPEYEEISMLCNRVIIMREGKIKKELAAEELSEYKLLSYAIGSSDEGGKNEKT